MHRNEIFYFFQQLETEKMKLIINILIGKLRLSPARYM